MLGMGWWGPGGWGRSRRISHLLRACFLTVLLVSAGGVLTHSLTQSFLQLGDGVSLASLFRWGQEAVTRPRAQGPSAETQPPDPTLTPSPQGVGRLQSLSCLFYVERRGKILDMELKDCQPRCSPGLTFTPRNKLLMITFVSGLSPESVVSYSTRSDPVF